MMKSLAPCISKHSRRLAGVLVVIFCVLAMSLAVPGSIWAASDGAVGWTSTDSYRVMNFVVLTILLILVLRKPASQALNNRIKNIATHLEDLENRKADVEKQLAEYNNRLAMLDQEAEQIIAEYVRQGEEAKLRIMKEAQASAQKLEEHAQKTIEYEFDQARNALQTVVVEKALAKAEEIIKTRISAADQERLVDEYITKVVVS